MLVTDNIVNDFRMNAEPMAAVSGAIGGDNQPANQFPQNTVTLTYDDGPDAYTLDIATYLRDQGIRATFFVRTCRLIGQPRPATLDPGDTSQPPICLRQCPSTPCPQQCAPGSEQLCGQFPASWLQQLKDMGHRIANHTKNHYHLDSASQSTIVSEVSDAQQLLDSYVTDGVYAFRAPYHSYSSSVGAAIRTNSALNKLTGPVGDDVDANDWDCAHQGTSPATCAQLYVDNWNSKPRKNGIIQLHNGNEFAPGTDYPLQLTKALVPLLKAQGARFVPLDAVPGITGARTFGPATFRSSDFSDTSDGGKWSTAPSYFQSIHLADVGGDSRADICGRGPNGIACGIAGATAFAAATLWKTPDFSDSDGWLPPQYGTTIQFGQVGGSAKLDVCGRGFGGIYCAISNGVNGFGTRTQWTTDFSNADGWDTSASYYQSIRLADVNGDGLADVCGRAAQGIYCALNTGTSTFAAKTLWTTDFSDAAGWSDPKYGTTIQFADINQDGRLDVCGRGYAGIWCGLGKQGGGFSPVSLRTQFGAFSDGDGWDAGAARYGSISLAKVNGDSYPDVCGRTATGIVCAFGDGTNFTNYVHVRNDYFTDSLSWNTDPYGSTIRFGDITGDGRADVCGRAIGGISCSTAP